MRKIYLALVVEAFKLKNEMNLNLQVEQGSGTSQGVAQGMKTQAKARTGHTLAQLLEGQSKDRVVSRSQSTLSHFQRIRVSAVAEDTSAGTLSEEKHTVNHGAKQQGPGTINSLDDIQDESHSLAKDLGGNNRGLTSWNGYVYFEKDKCHAYGQAAHGCEIPTGVPYEEEDNGCVKIAVKDCDEDPKCAFVATATAQTRVDGNRHCWGTGVATQEGSPQRRYGFQKFSCSPVLKNSCSWDIHMKTCLAEAMDSTQKCVCINKALQDSESFQRDSDLSDTKLQVCEIGETCKLTSQSANCHSVCTAKTPAECRDEATCEYISARHESHTCMSAPGKSHFYHPHILDKSADCYQKMTQQSCVHSEVETDPNHQDYNVLGMTSGCLWSPDPEGHDSHTQGTCKPYGCGAFKDKEECEQVTVGQSDPLCKWIHLETRQGLCQLTVVIPDEEAEKVHQQELYDQMQLAHAAEEAAEAHKPANLW